MSRKNTGDYGEKLAKDFLKKRGYSIIETNYRCPYGEIDIVARQKGTLSFIEVRTKQTLSFGIPEESVTASKAKRMKATAYHYLQSHDNLPASWRIDFVAVDLDPQNKTRRIELFQNAITEE